MRLRKLTAAGNTAFKEWLQSRNPGDMPPERLVMGGEETEELKINIEIDESRQFRTRYDFGQYMTALFEAYKAPLLLAELNDGLWNWLIVIYFSQFGRKTSKYWHYLVTRKGHSGSLTYRHLARTSFEMFWRHREYSMVMLNVGMETWGDMSEQLTSRQNVAYHRGYMAAANALYLDNGKLRRGSAGRVPPVNRRKPGDRRGRGGAARLALAVRRLCRTYDTHMLDTSQMIQLLPREFSGFSTQGAASADQSLNQESF